MKVTAKKCIQRTFRTKTGFPDYLANKEKPRISRLF